MVEALAQGFAPGVQSPFNGCNWELKKVGNPRDGPFLTVIEFYHDLLVQAQFVQPRGQPRQSMLMLFLLPVPSSKLLAVSDQEQLDLVDFAAFASRLSLNGPPGPISSDSGQPWPKSLGIFQLRQASIRRYQRFLGDLIGHVAVTHDLLSQNLNGPAVAPHEFVEGGQVAYRSCANRFEFWC
jgi:hypothetical protein